MNDYWNVIFNVIIKFQIQISQSCQQTAIFTSLTANLFDGYFDPSDYEYCFARDRSVCFGCNFRLFCCFWNAFLTLSPLQNPQFAITNGITVSVDAQNVHHQS